MTPREQAKEIYFAMLNVGKGLISDFLAKQCTIIAVNKIIDAIEEAKQCVDDYSVWALTELIKDKQEVLTELEKL